MYVSNNKDLTRLNYLLCNVSESKISAVSFWLIISRCVKMFPIFHILVSQMGQCHGGGDRFIAPALLKWSNPAGTSQRRRCLLHLKLCQEGKAHVSGCGISREDLVTRGEPQTRPTPTGVGGNRGGSRGASPCEKKRKFEVRREVSNIHKAAGARTVNGQRGYKTSLLHLNLLF